MPLALKSRQPPTGPPPEAPARPESRGRTVARMVFAGDPRVWRVAGIVALPLALLILIWCLVPRAYYTGTDSVEDYTYVAQTPAHQPTCVSGLRVPAGTARLRFRIISRTQARPALHLALRLDGAIVRSDLPPTHVPTTDRISTAIFSIPQRPAHPASVPASLCLTAEDLVNWGGTPTLLGEDPQPTLNGQPLTARVAVWYMPPRGAQRSYLSEAGGMFTRAALFRPGWIGSWTYFLAFFFLLPAVAVLAVRCLALAAAGRTRRLAAWLFAIAALNAICWSLITPAFQGPDEVDHFAYVESLAERGHAPSRNASSPLPRWSSSEQLAIEGTKMLTNHQVGDSRAPAATLDEQVYERRLAALRPSHADGGGNETAATHGPVYYLALVPAYALGKPGSVWSELTLMRFLSALIGALTVVFTYLLARELAPRRPWLAVLAALLVGFEPMYGFISGIVNNDVGVNAGAAAVELLLIRMLRRGLDWRWGLLTGALLLLLPDIKGTAYSLYPVAALVLLATLWRHHSRRNILGFGTLAGGALAVRELSTHFSNAFEPSAGNSPGVGSTLSASTSALHQPGGYLSYLWQAFLPRLPFMTKHFESLAYPGFVIFDERGWGAFGWYDLFYSPWVYSVILVAMVATPVLAVASAVREWAWVRRHWIEAAVVILMPVAVIGGFVAAFYTPGARPAIAEFGRYAFPAIGPVAVLVVASLSAFGRRRMLAVGAGLLVCLLALSYAGQLVTLTGFYS